MLLRLLITAAILLALAKHYLHDSKVSTEQPIKPKAQTEEVQQQLESFRKENIENKQQTLNKLGL